MSLQHKRIPTKQINNKSVSGVNSLDTSIVKEVDVELIDAAVAGGVHDQGTAAPAAARVSCVHTSGNSIKDGPV